MYCGRRKKKKGFFFFKQKTAYEIKECDWSSDVCSSDLQTVRNHIRHIYEKLQVHTKSQAVVKAIREGLA